MSNSAPPNKITDKNVVLKIRALVEGKKVCRDVKFEPDKLRHKHSFYHFDNKDLEHDISPYADGLTITIEIKLTNNKNFKFRLESDQILTPFFRYDSTGTSHRNRKLPLGKNDSIPTPHFNTFDADGDSIAYRTEIIEKQAAALEFVDFALNHFFKEGNIDSQGVNPSVTLAPQLFATTTVNPLDGITF